MNLKRLTDAQGNPVRLVCADPTQLQVKKALVEAVLDGSIVISGPEGGTLSYNLSDTWKANGESALTAVVAEMQAWGNDAIPFFIQTDLHGRNNDPARWLHNLNDRIMNINLGDNATDYFNTGELEAYYESVRDVQNKICVFGNHDVWTKSGSDKAANYHDLAQWFPSDGKRIRDKHGYFTVKDDRFNVKYVVLCPYYINLENETNGVDLAIRTAQMEWLIQELSADDGYDIVILMHQLFHDDYQNREGVKQNWSDAQPIFQQVWNVLKDRRNNRSGSVTDSNAQTHSYDFSNVKSRILCALHGHTHEELMVTEEGMTAYAANWYGDGGACVFGVINRERGKLKIWAFGANSVSDVLELDI